MALENAIAILLETFLYYLQYYATDVCTYVRDVDVKKEPAND